jgi:hypothetical protein
VLPSNAWAPCDCKGGRGGVRKRRDPSGRAPSREQHDELF